MDKTQKTKLQKENLKQYIVTNVKDPKYRRVWKKASLVHYCNKLYGINFKEWTQTHRGKFNEWRIEPAPAQNRSLFK